MASLIRIAGLAVLVAGFVLGLLALRAHEFHATAVACATLLTCTGAAVAALGEYMGKQQKKAK